MKTLKIIGITIGLVMGFATGLGTVSAQTVQVPAPGESETVDAIRKEGALKAGAGILAPWLLRDPGSGEYLGSAAAAVNAIAKELGVKVAWVDVTWDVMIAGLLAKKYDLGVGGMFATPERLKVIDMSKYDREGTCYAVRSDSPIDSLDKLNDAKLVYLGYSGYATDKMFSQKYPETQVQQVSPPPGPAPRVDDVLKGRGDIASLDSSMVYWVNQRWSGIRIIPAPDDCIANPDIPQDIGMGYRKGDPAFGKFLDAVFEKNAQTINDAKRQYSDPKWLSVNQ